MTENGNLSVSGEMISVSYISCTNVRRALIFLAQELIKAFFEKDSTVSGSLDGDVKTGVN